MLAWGASRGSHPGLAARGLRQSLPRAAGEGDGTPTSEQNLVSDDPVAALGEGAEGAFLFGGADCAGADRP